ncbi:binary toxin-like calcium binding domain-containing protein [Bacillus cereus group sp. BfR-BA-01349]|uniref:binary toxin-like calcium binding domain-containing protein n=1 Tax=Bacillus cereus group sp. BfR-BA-01349 TaxID=2920312 RepID=UPI001F566AA0
MQLKNVYKCLTITTLLAQIAVSPSASFAEKTQETNKNQKETSQVQKQEKISTGLIGQYFIDNQFTEVSFIQVDEKNTLLSKEKVKADTSNIQSIRWVGNIKPDETGDYTFSTSNNENVIIQGNGETVVKQKKEKKSLRLEKDKLYEIKIEQQIKKGETEELQLLWSKNQEKEILIPEKSLLSPNYSQKSEVKDDKQSLLPNQNLFDSQTELNKKKGSMSLENLDIDTDGDGIPNILEENGYTFKDNAIVAWNDTYAAQGYKKYVSSPRTAKTAEDPYTDFQKVTGKMPAATKNVARDPLIAAYPSVGVGMEKIHFSPNQIETEGQSGSKTKSVTETNSTTHEVSVGGKLGFNDKGFSFEISPSYKHSWTKSTAIQNSETESWAKQIAVNPSTAAYLSANVRYHNEGTAPIYDLAPTSNFVLQNENKSIGTVTANKNTIANSLAPGATYPAKGTAPIFINQANEAGTVKMEINGETLDAIQDGREIVNIETTQNKGQYGIINESGNQVPGGEWDPIRTNIDTVSGELTLNLGIGKENVDRRIAAKDSRDPEDKRPEITVKEAIKKAFDATEKDGRLIYTDAEGNDIIIDESALNIIFDEKTKKEVEAQLANMKDKKIYNVKWKRGMKMTLHVPEAYYDFETQDNTFAYAYTLKDSGPNSGKTHGYMNGNSDPSYAKRKLNLKPYTSYTAKAYVRADRGMSTEATFFVGEPDVTGNGGRGANVRGKIEGDEWKLVELAFNTGPNPEFFKELGFKTVGNGRLHFDDVSVTEWKQTENIQQSHVFKDWTVPFDTSTNKYRVSNVKLSKFPSQKVRYQLLFNDSSWGEILPDSNIVDKNGERTISFGTGSHAPATDNKIGVFAVDEKNHNLKVKVAEFGGATEQQIKNAHRFNSWIPGQQKRIDGLYFNSMEKNILSQITEYKISLNNGFQIGKPRNNPESDGRIKLNFLDYNSGYGFAKGAWLKVWAVVRDKDILIYEGWTGD